MTSKTALSLLTISALALSAPLFGCASHTGANGIAAEGSKHSCKRELLLCSSPVGDCPERSGASRRSRTPRSA